MTEQNKDGAKDVSVLEGRSTLFCLYFAWPIILNDRCHIFFFSLRHFSYFNRKNVKRILTRLIEIANRLFLYNLHFFFLSLGHFFLL